MTQWLWASLSFVWLTINQNLGLQTTDNASGLFGLNVSSMNVGMFICLFTNIVHACTKEKTYGRNIGYLRNDRENENYRVGGIETIKEVLEASTRAKLRHTVRTLPRQWASPPAPRPLKITCCCPRAERNLPWSFFIHVTFFRIKVQKGVSCVLILAPKFMDLFSFGSRRWAVFFTRTSEIRNSPNSKGSADTGQPKTCKISIVASKVLLLGSNMLVNV